MFRIASVVAVVLLGQPADQQRVGRAECRLSYDRTAVSLSGELILTLVIEGPGPVDVDVPRPITASADWRVVAEVPRTSSLSPGRERWEQRFRLEPFQFGEVKLPLLPIRVRTGNEVRDWIVAWPERTITVTSVVAEADLGSARPVTNIERPPASSSGDFPWLIGIGVVVLVMAVAWWRRRRRRVAALLQTPRDRALAELDHFAEPQPITAAELPLIADVLRRFLEAEFHLAATRQTTAEFLAAMSGVERWSDAERTATATILAACDLVKFAGVTPTASECRTIWEQARALIAERRSD